jgi:hypothetical protein
MSGLRGQQWRFATYLISLALENLNRCQGQGWNEAYHHKLVAAWMRILLTILLVMSLESQPTSWPSHSIARTCDRNLGFRLLYNGLPKKFGLITLKLSTPPMRNGWSQQVVMAACHCYSWWRWQSDTLWATLIRLWLTTHTHSQVMFKMLWRSL